jgi:hypothetical protein
MRKSCVLPSLISLADSNLTPVAVVEQWRLCESKQARFPCQSQDMVSVWCYAALHLNMHESFPDALGTDSRN